MTEKRYYKRMWEEEYYIFDSQIISEKDFDEKVEYEDYQAFADSMIGDEVVDRLNELNDKNKFLSDFRGFITMEHQKIKEENEELKQVLGSILLEVKKDITNTSCTGEIKVFINPNSFNLISDVLRKYGALKEWYE